jgi:hypothetical protein
MEKEMNYPDYWPCKHCGRPFSKHVQIGEPDQEWKGYNMWGDATINWCLPKDDPNNKGYGFKPVDNLTLIEMIANERQVSF